jgi:hypothetical protein
MMLWLRARRVWWLGVATLVLVAFGAVVGDAAVAVPSLFASGGNSVFLRTYLPLVWASAISTVFSGRCLSVESRPALLSGAPFGVAVSRLGLLDALLFLASSVAVAVLSASLGFGALGAFLAISGIACVATLFAGAGMGAFASTMAMLLTSLYPRMAPGSRFVHIFAPGGNVQSSLLCGVVFALVAAAMLAGVTARTRFRPFETTAW